MCEVTEEALAPQNMVVVICDRGGHLCLYAFFKSSGDENEFEAFANIKI